MAKLPRCEIHNIPIWPRKGCRACAVAKMPWLLISTDGYTEVTRETEYHCSPYLVLLLHSGDTLFAGEILVAIGEQNEEEIWFSQMVAVTEYPLNGLLEVPMYNLMGLYIPKGLRVSMRLRNSNTTRIKARLVITEWLGKGNCRNRFL